MEKTYVFDNGGDGGCNMNGLITALCNRQGIDPGYLMAMMNNGGFGGNGDWIWILVLLIFGWNGVGGNGFGGRCNAQGIADAVQLLNGNDGRELLLQAISGNGNAIGQLSTKLGCDFGALNAALQNLSTQICTLGGQIGLGQKDIVAAITNGNQSILSKLCDCCCSTQRQISDFRGDIALQMCQQTNTLQSTINTLSTGVERGFAATNYAFADQTCQLKNEINALKQYVGDQFCQDRMEQMRRENQNLRDQVQAYQLSASQQTQTANIVSQLQPVPRPAYLVTNPNGCGCGNYGYYPYGNNGCCNNGCNNNCNPGCGCC